MNEGIIIAIISGIFGGGGVVSVLNYFLNRKSSSLDIYKKYDKLKDEKISELTDAVRELSEQQKRMQSEQKRMEEERKVESLRQEAKINRLIDTVMDIGCYRKDPCQDPRGRLHINESQLSILAGEHKYMES